MVDSNSTPPPWEYPHTKPVSDWRYGYQAGYRTALEEAARVADDYAKIREEMSQEEDDRDYAERELVYAKHVRRVAAAIRTLKDGNLNEGEDNIINRLQRETERRPFKGRTY